MEGNKDKNFSSGTWVFLLVTGQVQQIQYKSSIPNHWRISNIGVVPENELRLVTPEEIKRKML